MLRNVTVLLALCLSLFAVQDVSYVRYYRTAEDFKIDVTMKASERAGVNHLRVFYDKYDRLLSKAKIDEYGTVLQEEIYEYSFSGTLLRRSIRDGSGNVETMYVYWGNEKMSAAFLAYAFPHRDMGEFSDRVTIYSYLPGGEIDRYQFSSVDGTLLGTILYEYFDSGLVKEERWIKEPRGKTIRLFRYDHDPESRTYELTEYDSTGQKVSHVGVVNPPDGKSNYLEESTEIIQDIRQKRAAGWDPGKQPGSLADLIRLNSGDILRVNLIQITDRYVRFKMMGEEDTLTIPLSQVGEIERQGGKTVYPVVY
ncbi:MAG: hypothetical protein V3U24_11175 [Candidatus Neomarinimicrobiota bacterium]